MPPLETVGQLQGRSGERHKLPVLMLAESRVSGWKYEKGHLKVRVYVETTGENVEMQGVGQLSPWEAM